MSKTKWMIDPSHSEVNFKVKHLMISNVTGTFGKVEVKAETEGDDFNTLNVSFSADVNSISTGNNDRDNHLKSADFFDAANNPSIKFVSTKYEKGSGGDKLTGDLTIRNTTLSVVLDVENNGMAKDPWGNLKAGFSIQGKISRSAFGLTWNAALETGGMLVSDEVRINCEIQLLKQNE